MAGLTARSYRIEEYTRTVCPHCFAERQRRSDEADTFLDGMLVSHDGSVWMRRFCPVHGETESLYEEDLEIWQARSGWSTPTLEVIPDREDNFGGFPAGYRSGLPASHGQHTCILLLNVTENCNYSCPTCYAAAKAPGSPVESPILPSLDKVLRTVDTMLVKERGKLAVVMVSGGEPTVRKDLEQLIESLLERNITRVMLNTNGRRIARDDKFVKFLQKNRDRIEVYLQFDGFRPSTHIALRGEDVGEEKLLALKRLNQAGIFTTLVATVVKGVNDDEVGQVLQLGLDTPRCAGLAIQPMFGSGRTPTYDPMSRVTPTGVLRRLGEQTGGLVDWTDFIPLPCSHKDCCDISYLVKTKDGWKSLANIIGRGELKSWIHLVANTISFDNASELVKELVKNGLHQKVFSEQEKVTPLQLAIDILRMCDCIPGLADLIRSPSESLEKMAEKTFRVSVKMFMDANTFHDARIRQCCTHVGTFEDYPRRHSFCWRWLFADATDFPTGRSSTLKVLN